MTTLTAKEQFKKAYSAMRRDMRFVECNPDRELEYHASDYPVNIRRAVNYVFDYMLVGNCDLLAETTTLLRAEDDLSIQFHHRTPWLPTWPQRYTKRSSLDQLI